MKINSECPVCAAEVVFPEDAVEGELISCPDCGTELEIVSINPPNLEEAPQEEEDWGE